MSEAVLAPASLRRSIITLLVVLFAAQAAGFVAVVLGYRTGYRLATLFLPVSAVYHAGLAVFLVWRRNDFRYRAESELPEVQLTAQDGVPAEQAPIPRVNLSNVLTISRLSAIPTAVFLILLTRRAPLLPIVLPFLAAVFVTDFFDGIVARRRGEITLVGSYLDSMSDYLIIIATSIVFYIFRLVPLWMFALVLARLVLFAAFMALATFMKGKANPVSTFLGKASVFAIMVLYVWEVVKYLGVPYIGHPVVVQIVEYAVAVLIGASFVDKAVFLRRLFAGKLS